MVKMIKFPSIGQFRNVVHHVTSRAQWVGKDENGDSIYDTSRPLPKLKFRGSIKLHGTNASVVMDHEGTVWCQSRENIITPLSDNAGFAAFVHANRRSVVAMLDHAKRVKAITDDQVVAVFGEWCGGNIQSGVGLSQLPKMFVVAAIARVDADGTREWFSDLEVQNVVEQAAGSISDFAANIHNIHEFPTYTVEIDFARPHDVQQTLSDLTIAVEDQCPVAKHFGATPEKGSIIGEGIVWVCVTPGYEDSGYWFKVKGEKHAAKTRVKTLTPVDVARVDAIQEIAVRVTPDWRLDQMLQETFDTLNGGVLDIKRMGDYIKAVIQDVVKEDLDVIVDAGFTVKDVSGSISKIARDFMFNRMKFKEAQ